MAITDDAIEKIKGMIVSGALRPGDRLPREADLAERLGLSRNSLREAVKALSLVQVLDVRQGDGTYVTSLEPAVLLHAMGFVIDFHRDDTALEFLEVRRILEPAAAGLAAARMTVSEAADLRVVLDKLGDDPTVAELVAHDLEFHRRIAAGSGNQVLSALIDGLSGPTQRTRIWRDLVRDSAVEQTVAEHRAICDAVGARQPDVARAWTTVHIAGIERRLRETMTGPHPVR